MCACVCVCVCECVCVYACVCVCAWYMCVCLLVCVCVHVCMCVHVRMYVGGKIEPWKVVTFGTIHVNDQVWLDFHPLWFYKGSNENPFFGRHY